MNVWKYFACHIGLVDVESNETAEKSQQEDSVLVSKLAVDAGQIKRKELCRSDTPQPRGERPRWNW